MSLVAHRTAVTYIKYSYIVITIISYHIISYHIISYHIISYHIISLPLTMLMRWICLLSRFGETESAAQMPVVGCFAPSLTEGLLFIKAPYCYWHPESKPVPPDSSLHHFEVRRPNPLNQQVAWTYSWMCAAFYAKRLGCTFHATQLGLYRTACSLSRDTTRPTGLCM